MWELAPLKMVVEAALLAAGGPLSLDKLAELFESDAQPTPAELRRALDELAADCVGRGVELKQVASGWRYQIRPAVFPQVSKLWTERSTRYTRATLETLALIAYRQPITRGEIEAIRGVSVSSNILKALEERDWIRVLGHRDVPGRPTLYGTTRGFLDYFNLQSLSDLPTLAELAGLDGPPALSLSGVAAGPAAPAPRKRRPPPADDPAPEPVAGVPVDVRLPPIADPKALADA
ncbi:MAG: SMC-Scp complex subunit ScpB, partial [Xanthomonadales bacterium]|nr:SMC-Scp complex subunit ScpB [Xanthomonadales bacterium]